jgi:hypothetical protein
MQQVQVALLLPLQLLSLLSWLQALLAHPVRLGQPHAVWHAV